MGKDRKLNREIFFAYTGDLLTPDEKANLKFSNPSWVNYPIKGFEINPRMNIDSFVGIKYFKKIKEDFGKEYGVVELRNGFYVSSPEKFVLTLEEFCFEDSERLDTGLTKRRGKVFGSDHPIIKSVPNNISLYGKVTSDEESNFKNPGNIIKILNANGFKTRYNIEEIKNKDQKILVEIEEDSGYAGTPFG